MNTIDAIWFWLISTVNDIHLFVNGSVDDVIVIFNGLYCKWYYIGFYYIGHCIYGIRFLQSNINV